MRFFFTALLLLLVLLLSWNNTFAQESECAIKLSTAREKFDAGLVQEVPGLLNDCIANGFNNEERIQAYKLLINAYIFDDNLKQAEATVLIFLKNFPDYKAGGNDTPELTNLLNRL